MPGNSQAITVEEAMERPIIAAFRVSGAWAAVVDGELRYIRVPAKAIKKKLILKAAKRLH